MKERKVLMTIDYVVVAEEGVSNDTIQETVMDNVLNRLLDDAEEGAGFCMEALDVMVDPTLSTEEQATYEVIRSARKIQEFLWGDMNQDCGLEEYRRMFRKRLAKLDQIDESNPHWKVEMRKRLLQVAGVAINMIGKLDDGHDFKDKGVITNLPQHALPNE